MFSLLYLDESSSVVFIRGSRVQFPIGANACICTNIGSILKDILVVIPTVPLDTVKSPVLIIIIDT